MFAVKHGYRFDANQELLVSRAKRHGRLGHGFPLAADVAIACQRKRRARTPLSGFIAALLMLLIVLIRVRRICVTSRSRLLAASLLMAVKQAF